MKVLVVGPGPKFLSGISYFTWKLSSTLNSNVILFRDMLPTFLFPGHKRVGQVESKIQYNTVSCYLDWWNPLTWIRAVIVCRSQDIVVLEWWTASVAHMYAFILAFCWRSDTKFIIEMHEVLDPLETSLWPVKWYARLMRKFILGRSDAIVVHSNADLSLMNDTYGKLSVIPHGLYDQYKILPCSCPDFEVLFFGLIRDYKGVKYLIEGFQKANLPHSLLDIEGEQWDKLPEVDDYRIFMNDFYIEDWEIELFFSCADVVALPYLRASSSGVAHIAMHYGLPIIATRVGGLGELDDYEGMFYVPVADSNAIAEQLNNVYTNYRGKRFKAPERLEWSSIRDKWYLLFQEM